MAVHDLRTHVKPKSHTRGHIYSVIQMVNLQSPTVQREQPKLSRGIRQWTGLPKLRRLTRAGVHSVPSESGLRIRPCLESLFWVSSLHGPLEVFFLMASPTTELLSGTRSIVAFGSLTALQLGSMLRRDMTFTTVRRRQERESTPKIATAVQIC